MSEKILRILHLDDDSNDRVLLRRHLENQRLKAEIIESNTLPSFIAGLERSPDLVLADYRLHGFNCLDALKLMHKHNYHMPLIVVSGTIGEESAVEVLKKGATDYILKDNLVRLVPAIERAMKEAKDLAEKTEAQKKIQGEEARFRTLVEQSLVGIYVIQGSQFVYVNPKTVKMLGYAAEEITSQPLLNFIHPEDRPLVKANIAKRFDGAISEAVYALRLIHCSGATIHVQAHGSIVQYEGRPAILGTLLDLTEHLSTEAQLRQAQKMESVGHLAAGIAHDFNNLLTVIQGHAACLVCETTTDSTRLASREIYLASERAAKLTRQLLTFSRQQPVRLQPLDINIVVSDLTNMLQRLLGGEVALQLKCQPALPLINADEGMIEQVLLNLAVNARDAMPQGGTLTIETQEKRKSVKGVALIVSDSGTGIARENLPRLFEPFFTTKPAGKGTGLGLATVYGIVKQHGGSIEVASELGKGTRFEIVFSLAGSDRVLNEIKTGSMTSAGGNEAILVVEDEVPVRQMVKIFLERHGYKVVEAATGVEAIAKWREKSSPIDLILTDVIMPDGLKGTELIEVLKKEHPTLRYVLTSGYSPERFQSPAHFEEGRNFLQKPYHPSQLISIVRKALDAHDTLPL